MKRLNTYRIQSYFARRDFVMWKFRGISHGTLSALSLMVTSFLIVSCSTVTIHANHPAIQEVTPDTLTASVYFIRPQPVKPKGVADKPILVTYAKQPLLTIDEGSYTLLKIKPGQGEIATHSETRFINKSVPIKVSRKRLYTFLSGRTYFIHLKRIDEEFRGIYYDPQPVGLETAQALTARSNVSSRGISSDESIDKIQSVPMTPQASELEPAYPEGLYPQTPYLLKKPKQQ